MPWSCTECTFVNMNDGYLTCEMCSRERVMYGMIRRPPGMGQEQGSRSRHRASSAGGGPGKQRKKKPSKSSKSGGREKNLTKYESVEIDLLTPDEPQDTPVSSTPTLLDLLSMQPINFSSGTRSLSSTLSFDPNNWGKPVNTLVTGPNALLNKFNTANANRNGTLGGEVNEIHRSSSHPNSGQGSPHAEVGKRLLNSTYAMAENVGRQVQRQRSEGDLKSTTLVSSASQDSKDPDSPSKAELIDSLFKHSDEQRLLLEELWSSEKTYVDSLRVLVTMFLQPLDRAIREGQGIVSKEEVNAIFSNVEQLMHVNIELLDAIQREVGSSVEHEREKKKLAKAMANKTGRVPSPLDGDGDTSFAQNLTHAITQAFKDVIPYFRMYSVYVNNYPVAIEKLKQLRQENQEFENFLNTVSAHEECKGLNLSAFLIMPVQRLCKYPLFFTRLLKLTPEGNMDYEKIKEATAVVNEITEKVNLDKSKAEKSLRGFTIGNIVSMQQLKKKTFTQKDYKIFEPGRYFVHEWESLVSKGHNRKLSSSEKIRHMFLFSNLLLITKKTGNKEKKNGDKEKSTTRKQHYLYETLHWIEVADLQVSDLEPLSSFAPEVVSGASKSKKGGSSFSPSNDSKDGERKWEHKITIMHEHIPITSNTSSFSGTLKRSKSRSKTKQRDEYTFWFYDPDIRRETWEQLRKTIDTYHEILRSKKELSPTNALASSRSNSNDSELSYDTSISNKPRGAISPPPSTVPNPVPVPSKYDDVNVFSTAFEQSIHAVTVSPPVSKAVSKKLADATNEKSKDEDEEYSIGKPRISISIGPPPPEQSIGYTEDDPLARLKKMHEQHEEEMKYKHPVVGDSGNGPFQNAPIPNQQMMPNQDSSSSVNVHRRGSVVKTPIPAPRRNIAQRKASANQQQASVMGNPQPRPAGQLQQRKSSGTRPPAPKRPPAPSHPTPTKQQSSPSTKPRPPPPVRPPVSSRTDGDPMPDENVGDDLVRKWFG